MTFVDCEAQCARINMRLPANSADILFSRGTGCGADAQNLWVSGRAQCVNLEQMKANTDAVVLQNVEENILLQAVDPARGSINKDLVIPIAVGAFVLILLIGGIGAVVLVRQRQHRKTMTRPNAAAPPPVCSKTTQLPASFSDL